MPQFFRGVTVCLVPSAASSTHQLFKELKGATYPFQGMRVQML